MTIQEVLAINHVLLMHVEPSMEVHANQADEVFMRIGDKSKRLTFDERMQLMYDKGDRFFEDKPVPDATLDDLDLDFVQEYIRKSKQPNRFDVSVSKCDQAFCQSHRGQCSCRSKHAPHHQRAQAFP